MKTSHVRTKCCHVPKRTTRSKRKMRKKLKLYLPLKKQKEEKQLNSDIKCACALKQYLQMALWR